MPVSVRADDTPKFVPLGAGTSEQIDQDSNLEPAALETAALAELSYRPRLPGAPNVPSASSCMPRGYRGVGYWASLRHGHFPHC